MKIKRVAIFVGLAGALAAGTLVLAAVLFAHFHAWVQSLPRGQLVLVSSGASLLTSLILALGVYVRRRANPADYEL